jgi:hypothetical protein
VIGDLERLVREHPYRERLRALLMLALYRAGRQADALAAYRDARAALVDEQGIEPSVELRELHEAILAQDETLLAGTSRLLVRAGGAAVPIAVSSGADPGPERASLVRQPSTSGDDARRPDAPRGGAASARRDVSPSVSASRCRWRRRSSP